MRIGIDVGGTNTDAVLLRGREVVGEVKTLTTPDITSGIVAALRALVQRTKVPASQVQAVMIGTTHFINAIVEAERLLPTAAIRLGLPATKGLPPMIDWPERLRRALGAHVYLCHGGHEFDGRELVALDFDELEDVARDVKAKGLRSIAITAVFSPVDPRAELAVGDFLREAVPDASISLSHEIGRLGLLERENATIMNACLRELASQIVGALLGAIAELGIRAPVYISQNDGTLMSAEYAERYPVLTFASGPSNSMRGAAFLSSLEDCAVVDIGGTTTDVGVLTQGFPREASVAVSVSGVRTNFRMPDIYSFALGGGSIVSTDGELSLGPHSVAYELPQRARVFGGDVLTATDLAVAAGLADIGDPARVANLDRKLVEDTLLLAEHLIDEAVDRMKVSGDLIPVVLVGGGSILLRDRVAGTSEVVRPEHYPVANAIGAAIAQIGGEIERVFSLAEMSRDEALEAARQAAAGKAVEAGADPVTSKVVDIEETPLAYLPGNATRIHVKVVGELRAEAARADAD
jgi:N-methylhydantoinase A/oxoprolinase/acetone carboxylase beta subunit